MVPQSVLLGTWDRLASICNRKLTGVSIQCTRLIGVYSTNYKYDLPLEYAVSLRI